MGNSKQYHSGKKKTHFFFELMQNLPERDNNSQKQVNMPQGFVLCLLWSGNTFKSEGEIAGGRRKRNRETT